MHIDKKKHKAAHNSTNTHNNGNKIETVTNDKMPQQRKHYTSMIEKMYYE